MYAFLSELSFYYWIAPLACIAFIGGYCLNNEGEFFTQFKGWLLQGVLIFIPIGLMIAIFIKQGWRAGVTSLWVGWLVSKLGEFVYKRRHKQLPEG
jgi:hypothetical protein